MNKSLLLVITLCSFCFLNGCGGTSAPPAAQFILTGTSTTVSAGTAVSFTVTAVGSNGHTASGYAGTVHFYGSDTQAMLPPDSKLANGVGTFSVKFKTAGGQYIGVNDLQNSSISSGTLNFGVTAGTATRFTVATPSSDPVGGTFNFTVSAQDAYNNAATNYSGTVHFSSTDPLAKLPPNSPLASGTGTFSAILATLANETITATDTVTSSITGVSPSISVTKVVPLAITSPAPPNGAYQQTYGPDTPELQYCIVNSGEIGGGRPHFSCTPCTPQENCSQIPPCQPQFQHGHCTETKEVVLGFTLTASGGVPGYTWTLQGGSSLPPGLTLNNGVISGTPTTPGTYTVNLNLSDTAAPPDQLPVSYQITIAAPPPPAINATPLPAIATLNSPYVGFTFMATGTAPLSWSESGPLPTGMSLSPTGVLTGTPTLAGAFPISLMAQDSLGQTSTPQNFTIQVLAKGFVPTGSLQTARVRLTATLLADGKVLVAGGVNNTTFPTTAELYDPAAGTFAQTTGSLTTVRVDATATLLKSGKVLLAGGSSGNTQVATAELYDPTSQTFTPTTGSMSTARSFHVATLLNDGSVLVTGGLDPSGASVGAPVATAEIYDPSTNSFTSTSGPMTIGRFFHTATLLPSGKVLITGGLSSGQNLSSAELYDPATKTFSAAGAMTVVRMGHTATMLGTGKVLLAGGGNSFGGTATNTAELYDPTAGTFTATTAMANARSSHTATLLSSGQVLLAGGASQFFATGPSSSISAAELFDPTTGNFSETADLIDLREAHTATLLQTGDVLVVGGADGTIGYSNPTTVYSTAELYQ